MLTSLGPIHDSIMVPPTMSHTKSNRTLSDFHYELLRLNHKLNKPKMDNYTQKEYNSILMEIDKLTKELDVFNQNLEKKIQFLGLSPRSWSWIRDGVCAVGVLAAISTLVSSVVTARYGYSNSSQTEATATVTTGIISSAWGLCYGIIAGTYWLVENRKNEAMAAQTAHLEESKHISKFWTYFKEIRDITEINNNTVVDNNDITVTINDDATATIGIPNEKSFAKCVECIREIKKTNDTTPERLGSMLADTRPDLKKLFAEQQKINEQIQQLLENEKMVSKSIVVKNVDDSDSTIDTEVFLQTAKATSDNLTSSDSNAKALKEECQKNLLNNFNIFSEILGINISKMYINQGYDKRPIILLDNSFYPNEQSKI